MALLAFHWGADRVGILDRVPVRLERARSLGLTPFNIDDADMAEQIRRWADASGPHTVIVTPATTKAAEMGFNLAGPGATVMLYGPPAPDDIWPLNANRMFFQEINVTGSYSAGPYDTRRALSILRNRVIDPEVLITHRFPMAQVKREGTSTCLARCWGYSSLSRGISNYARRPSRNPALGKSWSRSRRRRPAAQT
jgi:L-iditol 2-dehydrogenase